MERVILALLIIVKFALWDVSVAQAQNRFLVPYQGRVVKNDGSPISETANFNIKIKTPDESCTLWEENQTATVLQGYFHLLVGSGTQVGTTAYTFSQVFITGTDYSSTCPSYTATSSDDRKIVVTIDLAGETVNLVSQAIKASPFAFEAYQSQYAQNAAKVGGVVAADVLTVSGASSDSSLRSRNLSTSEFQRLVDLLNGTSSSQIPLGLGTYTTAQESSSTFTQGQIWYNTDTNEVRYYNGTSDVNLCDSTSAVSQVNTGTGLLGGPITTTGTISVDVGTTAGKIVQLDGSGKLPAIDGSQLTNLNTSAFNGTVPVSKGGTGLTAMGVANQVIGVNNAATGLEYKFMNAGTGITITNSAGGITITSTGSGSTVSTVSATAPIVVSNASTTPALSLSPGTVAGQNLRWNGSAWVAANLVYTDLINSVSASPWPSTSCTTGQGVVWSSTSDSFTCADITVPTSNISGVLSTANIPSLDASKITTGILPIARGGTGLGTLGTANQILGLNAAATAFENKTLTAGAGIVITNSANTVTITNTSSGGTVTQVNTGNGLTGGPITSTGTIAVDAGTGANQIVQLDASARLPAVDASQVTNLNPANFSATVPVTKGGTGLTALGSSNQVLGVNAAGTAMEYKTVTAGSGVTVANTANTITVSATGTVTSLSATAPITVTNGSTTPALGLASGTSTGQTLRWSSGAWSVASLNLHDLVNNSGASPWPASDCTTGQAVTWVSANDNFTCATITVNDSNINWSSKSAATFFAGPTSGGAATPAFRTIASTDVNTVAYVPGGNSFGATATLGTNDSYGVSIKTNNVARMTIDSSGNVGVGDSSPSSKLTVSGQMRLTQSYNASAATSFDWNNGNIQYTTASCGSNWTFSNMRDGGSYTLIVTGATSGTCTFVQSSPDTLSNASFKFVPANGPTVANTATIFTFVRAGSSVFVSWQSGYQ